MRVIYGLVAIGAACLATGVTAKDWYTDKLFRDAYDDRYWSSAAFVLITAINGTTGEEMTGCTTIGSLTGAISIENGWPFDAAHRGAVEERVFARPDRRFVFNRAEALAALGFQAMGENEGACQILRAGISAYREDRTSQIKSGRPGA